MLPRLEAEETMRGAEATALGSGAIEKFAAQEAWRRLRRQAQGGAKAKPASAAGLASMGIGVIEVPRADAVPETEHG